MRYLPFIAVFLIAALAAMIAVVAGNIPVVYGAGFLAITAGGLGYDRYLGRHDPSAP